MDLHGFVTYHTLTIDRDYQQFFISIGAMIISDLISLPTPQLSGGQIHNLGGKGKRRSWPRVANASGIPGVDIPRFFAQRFNVIYVIAMIKKHKSWNISAILSCFDLVQKVTFFLVVKWPSKRHPQTWNGAQISPNETSCLLKTGQLVVPITNLPIATMLNLLQATRWRMPGPIVLEYALL